MRTQGPSVFRLTADSTRTGRLPFSARPNVGKEKKTDRYCSQKAKDRTRSQEMNEENCRFSRMASTVWLIKIPRQWTLKGVCVKDLWQRLWVYTFRECLHTVRLLVCFTPRLVSATYCRTSQLGKPLREGVSSKRLCVCGWWWESTLDTPYSGPQRNSEQAHTFFFFF